MAGKKKVKTVPAGPEQDLAVVTGGEKLSASSAVDWWESNVALIGSEEDARCASAPRSGARVVWLRPGSRRRGLAD